MNISGIRSLIQIFQKNTEMQLPQKTGYRVLAAIAVLGIMIPCVVIVGVISYVMTEALIEVDNPGGGMLFEMQLLSAFSMVFGIMVIFAVLFFSSDREHLVTLPIPAHHLMIAKFLYAYVAESIMEFMVLLSVFAGYGLAVFNNIGAGAAFHPVSIISALLGTFMIPLVPMIYCAMFSLVLMAVLKGVKNEKIFYRMSTVFMVIFAAIFLYSLRGLGEINVANYVESLGSGNNLFLKTLNVIFFPVVWLCKAASRGDIIYLLLYLVANAVLLAVLFLLGKLLYQEGLYTAASLGSSKKAEIKNKDIRMESQFMSCLKKELRVILRTRAFSGNTAYINVLWPVGTFLLFHMTKDKENMLEFINQYINGYDRAEMIVLMIMISVAFIATALNSLASTAFTREGQHLALVKFIPVPFRTQIYAKACVSFMFTFPALLLTDIITGVYLRAAAWKMLLYAVLMLLAHVISLVIGMYLDSSSPYVKWDDEYSALRGNLNAFFNMAIMMVISAGVLVIGLILYELLGLPIMVYHIVMLIILAGIAIRLIMVGPRMIIENVKKMC